MAAYDVIASYATPVALSANTSLTFAYPTGRTQSSYIKGTETLSIPSRQTVFTPDTNYFVSYGVNAITLTWINTTLTLPANTIFRFGAQVYDTAQAPVNPGYVTVAFTGDSRLARGFDVSGNRLTSTRYTLSYGPAPYIEMLTGARVQCPIEYNFATSGYKVADCLALAPSVAATGATFVVMLMSVNDPKASTAEMLTLKSGIFSQVSTFLAAGKIVIIVPELPRGTSGAFTGAVLKRHLELSQWIRTLQTINNVYVADPWDKIGDTTATDGSYVSTYSSDGLHPNSRGMFEMARKIANIINSLIRPAAVLPGTSADIFDATDSPFGNLLTNGLLTGTGGTKTIATGNFADSWACTSPNADYAIVGSKVTSANSGRAMQQMAITTTALGANRTATFAQTFTTAALGLNAGNVVEAVAELEWDASASNVMMPTLELLFTTGAGTVRSRWASNPAFTADHLIPATAEAGVIRTQRIQVPSGTITAATLNVNMYGQSGTTGSATIRVGSIAVRRVMS